MDEEERSIESEMKMKRLEKLLEDEINEVGKYIKMKLSFGIDIFNISLPDTTIELKKIIYYIFNKFERTYVDNIILRQYLITYPEFIDTLKLRDQMSDPKELLFKISQNLKKEDLYQDRVVFYNGQYGKSFYLILEGEVSVLLPYEFKLRLTDKQVFKYMYYLLQLKEYELIRLMLENNKHIINDIDYRENTLYLKLKSYSERGLPSNIETEKISAQEYMKRYEYFSTIEKIQKNEKSQKETKEKKRNSNKDNDKIEAKFFELFLKENLRRRSIYSEIKFEHKCFENDEDDEEIIKNKEHFYEEEETFSIYKYFEVVKLAKGKCFGELALTKEGKKRNATIITTKHCTFGILQKEAYQTFIKECMDKARKANVEHLLKCSLFKGCNSEKFESHIFNCFRYIKKKKGEYLFKQGDKRDFIYFLKKGEIQLELFGNCFYLENIIHNLGYIDENSDIMELTKSKRLDLYCKINRKFKILILSDEVVGLEDHTKYPEKLEYVFSGFCTSYCELFALDIKFFPKIMNEKIIKNNYVHLIKERKIRLAKRLKQLKNNVILQQYNFIKENTKNHKNKVFYNNKHNIIENTDFDTHDNKQFRTIFDDYKHKNKLVNGNEDNNDGKKTIDNQTNYNGIIYPYSHTQRKTVDLEEMNHSNKIQTNSNDIIERSSSQKMNRKMYDSTKRQLKLKDEIINTKNSKSLFNRNKKNQRSNHFNSTYSYKFKNTDPFPTLNSNNQSNKIIENSNKFLHTESIIKKEDYLENKNKRQKLKNMKYINFRNIKISKKLLKQSNIINAEIDKINEIIINNYEKVTPSTYKKPKKNYENLLINNPGVNSKINQTQNFFFNSLSVDRKKKFFPLLVAKNKNRNHKSQEEDDTINFSKKNS